MPPAREAASPRRPTSRGPSPRLGYLLKHAQLQFTELVRAALEPLDLDGREWATLICLDDPEPLTQAEVARRAGIDRTTMVTLVDQLQERGFVRRGPHPDDRRKNMVELTAAGRAIRDRAAREVDAAERRFLAILGEPEAQRLKGALQVVITAGEPAGPLTDRD